MAAKPLKTRAAALSIASNTVLIVGKAVAGVVTGSVAILSDAVQSAIDLVASLITFFSVRKADEPADSTHQYGHEKLEDLSAGIEAVLLLVGAAVIAAQAIRRLAEGGHVDSIGAGMAVVAAAAVANLFVGGYLTRTARSTGSAALAADGAHLHTDALVSFGVLVALVLVKITGAQWIDAAVALMVAGAICVTGVRILLGAGRRLIDETLPAEELDPVRAVVESFVGGRVAGYHDLRARHVGSRHEVDLHLQFAAGTSLEEAHGLAHQVEHAIRSRLENTTVLVHLEPEDRVRADRFG
ncbi:MAG TPA: cation diffusion facilitator family transporter [Solirubrobacteraceae bacterium]|nr:cation diffusion facilitator family transporter [Solirubrobacteraceae bacterium]